MTAREKVLAAEHEALEVLAGRSDRIDCPFCGIGSTPEQQLLCCYELAVVVDAVLAHVNFKTQKETVERTLERLDKARGPAGAVVLN